MTSDFWKIFMYFRREIRQISLSHDIKILFVYTNGYTIYRLDSFVFKILVKRLINISDILETHRTNICYLKLL